MLGHYFKKDKHATDMLSSFWKLVNQKHLPSDVYVTKSLSFTSLI